LDKWTPADEQGTHASSRQEPNSTYLPLRWGHAMSGGPSVASASGRLQLVRSDAALACIAV